MVTPRVIRAGVADLHSSVVGHLSVVFVPGTCTCVLYLYQVLVPVCCICTRYLYLCVVFVPVEPEVEPGHDDNKDCRTVDLDEVVTKRTV